MSLKSWFKHTGVGRVLKHGWKGITSDGTPVFSEGGMFANIGSAVTDLLQGDAVGNLIKGSTGSGLTDAQKEKVDYETAAQNSLNEQDYYRKIDFYERFESPEALARQYKSAGINPALMYEGIGNVSASGGIGAGSAGSAGDSGVTSLLSVLGGLLSANMNYKSRQQQIEVERDLGEKRLELDRYKADLQAEYWSQLANESQSRVEVNQANVAKINADTGYRNLLIEWYPKLSQSTLGLNDQKISESLARTDLTRASIDEVIAKTTKHEKECQQIDALISKMDAEVGLILKQTDLTQNQILESRARINKMVAEIYEIGARIGLTQEQTRLYKYAVSKTTSDGFSLKVGPVSFSKSSTDVETPE